MSLLIDRYIEKVLLYADRRGDSARALSRELRDHLDQKTRVYLEAGVPLEDAVYRAVSDHGEAKVVGYRLRPRRRLIDVRTTGTARGVVAVGPRAVGVVAIGGTATGVFAFGGISVGVFGLGGLSLSLLLSWGGIAIAPLGLAYGGVCLGLLAIGAVAMGGWAGGAIDYSVWSFSVIPDVLSGLTRPFESKLGHMVFQGFMFAVMAALTAWSMILSKREQKRTGEASELVG
ncbi:MAG: hypothetical protein AAGG38_08365 [Planctomycetota bacterium]